LFCDGSLQERAAWAVAACLAASQCQVQLLVNRTCTLRTQIMHGKRGEYSRVPMPTLWCSLFHVYAVKSEDKQCTGQTPPSVQYLCE
jgi:hypothetical protein